MLNSIIGNLCFHQREKTDMGNVRIYNKLNIISFAKTTDHFGGLSNMAKNYPLFVNEILINSVESLYQACKFSLNPELQYEIISQKNPMRAKIISRQNQRYVRPDWDKIKYQVMEWCLKVKLMQNWDKFSKLLRETKDFPIVEYSKKDKVWGASPIDGNNLEGINALGRLLMKIRKDYIYPNEKPSMVTPPSITGFLLFGTPISTVYSPEYYLNDFEYEEETEN